MSVHYSDGPVTIWHGDCIDVMRTLPDASVDAVVTDPPYGLEFMGKEWDSFGRGEAQSKATAGIMRGGISAANGRPSFLGGINPKCTTCNRSQRGGSPCRCATPTFTDERGPRLRAFQAWCEEWATEALRVLKPGGHLLAFGGSRTFHRLTVGIEDAGFEIRDSIAWLYGSGFPKSLDVSKAIDKQRNDRDHVLAVTGAIAELRDAAGLDNRRLDQLCGLDSGGASAGHWTAGNERAQARIPAVEHWGILRDVLAAPAWLDAEVWRLNGRKGTAGDNWAAREVIGTNPNIERAARSLGGQINFGAGSLNADVTAPATPDAARWQGWGTALKPAFEPIVVARKPLAGTVAANVLAHGTGALNIDANRIAHRSEADLAESVGKNRHADFGTGPGGNAVYGDFSMVESKNYDGSAGRWPANVVLDESQAAALDRQVPNASVNTPAVWKTDGPGSNLYGDGIGSRTAGTVRSGYSDAGGASRFFYTAKAGADERPKADGIAHPTVKPVDLMRWLVRLVTPKGGTVLEPFAGSGTTVEAAVLEGFRCIAIEREADYLPLIMQRVSKPHAVGLDFGEWEDAS